MEVDRLNNDMGKFKKFAEYVRQRMDEDAAAAPTAPDANLKKATAMAAAKALKTTAIDPTKAKTNVEDMNTLRAKALTVAAKNPSLTVMPNVAAIDQTIGIEDQPSMMRKKMRR